MPLTRLQAPPKPRHAGCRQLGAPARCAPTAARCSPATRSSRGRAMPTTAGASLQQALASGAATCLVEDAKHRGLRLRRRPHRRAAGAEGGHRRHRARVLRPSPAQALSDRGHHRHQRQDQHGLVDGAGAVRCWAGAAASWARWALACPFAVEHTGLTTPDPVTLARRVPPLPSTRVLSACALEASSIGIVEHRLDAARKVDVALFTNFTQDHIDYHGSDGRLLGGQTCAVLTGRGCAPQRSMSTTRKAHALDRRIELHWPRCLDRL